MDYALLERIMNNIQRKMVRGLTPIEVDILHLIHKYVEALEEEGQE